MRSAEAVLDVLQVSDVTWDRTVGLAVAGLRHAVVHRVRSLPEALVRLAQWPRTACVLVQAGCDAAGLAQLAALRHRRHRPLALILLGHQGAAPAGSTVLESRNADSLTLMLTQIEQADEPAHGGGLPKDDVPGALDASRLHTRYQPIVAAADGRPVALEVLARLDHPTLGMLFPSQFVPQIEDAGLARQLTQAVIELTLSEHAEHLAELGLSLSVNFPLEVLIEQSFGDWLEQRRRQQSLPAERIIIELTESQPVAHLNAAQRTRLIGAMGRLRALGYRLAIDDYGPTMPRRQELFTLPFDLLKLDKSLVTAPQEPLEAEQAIDAAHRNGFVVVAEGIEDTAAWDRMRALGVDWLQGFMISRPLRCRQVTEWLTNWTARPRG